MDKRTFFKTGLLGIGGMLLAKKANALEYYPRSADWAILYSTWCGSSRDAAVWISEGMNGLANLFDVREIPDLSMYANIIVGGSIRSGKVSKELQYYLNKNKEMLKGKVRGHFAVCGNMMQPPTSKQTNELINNHIALLTETKDVPSRVFLGRVTFGLLDEESAKMLKGFNMPEYDNLKREECMAFGKEIFNSFKESV
ncbi:MAG: hypothetical protein JXA77_17600 [Bacteroidales bacterium]|nr:hypothetical protein [Bacteroidales bacterium]MBN2818001.1 hypothetical protein [Bacteroidales bacterium]